MGQLVLVVGAWFWCMRLVMVCPFLDSWMAVRPSFVHAGECRGNASHCCLQTLCSIACGSGLCLIKKGFELTPVHCSACFWVLHFYLLLFSSGEAPKPSFSALLCLTRSTSQGVLWSSLWFQPTCGCKVSLRVFHPEISLTRSEASLTRSKAFIKVENSTNPLRSSAAVVLGCSHAKPILPSGIQGVLQRVMTRKCSWDAKVAAARPPRTR